MKTVISDSAGALAQAAEHIRAVLEKKPEAVLALAGGRTMARLWAELARLYEAGALSLRRARVFTVAEYEGAPEALTCRRALEEGLLAKTDLAAENCRFLSPETLDSYDKMIEQAGGIDLAVLGIGDNGHIGFNEPATPFDSFTHRQRLTDATRRQNAGLFGGEALVPAFGLTLGIKPLTQARDILLLALGAEKAPAVFRAVYGKTESYTPASFLQLPLEVTFCLDREAAEKL